ncbi:unnamed protein product [Ostreobium quekettii]|uniref:SAYSvFN domain-containing protein n=1 Tax=Ostreobium quekettii TaxID=121088 RepID=A0A8S1JD63_9CHLO|nr:unnamed protein product [Ostreobium quekettii]
MAPRGAPPKHVSSMSDPEPSPEDEELKFRLHPDASPLQRRLTEILQQRLHVPDIVLLILFSVRPRVWAMLVLWFALSPVMARMDLGPVYILGTLFAVMLCNLGQRKEGEASAYTWFNNFQPLPGNLNADMIDNQLRRGQM